MSFNRYRTIFAATVSEDFFCTLLPDSDVTENHSSSLPMC